MLTFNHSIGERAMGARLSTSRSLRLAGAPHWVSRDRLARGAVGLPGGGGENLRMIACLDRPWWAQTA